MTTETLNDQTTTETGGLPVELKRLVGPKPPDWQVTAILLNGLFIETDCNSGRTRRIRKSMCSCGQAMLIEYQAETNRADGKRIFYPDQEDTGWCAFRCKKCHVCVHETVPGAEFE